MFEVGSNNGVYWLRLFGRFTFSFAQSWRGSNPLSTGWAFRIFSLGIHPRHGAVSQDDYYPGYLEIEVLGLSFRFAWSDTETVPA